jgi:hypothetical protein
MPTLQPGRPAGPAAVGQSPARIAAERPQCRTHGYGHERALQQRDHGDDAEPAGADLGQPERQPDSDEQ